MRVRVGTFFYAEPVQAPQSAQAAQPQGSDVQAPVSAQRVETQLAAVASK